MSPDSSTELLSAEERAEFEQLVSRSLCDDVSRVFHVPTGRVISSDSIVRSATRRSTRRKVRVMVGALIVVGSSSVGAVQWAGRTPGTRTVFTTPSKSRTGFYEIGDLPRGYVVSAATEPSQAAMGAAAAMYAHGDDWVMVTVSEKPVNGRGSVGAQRVLVDGHEALLDVSGTWWTARLRVSGKYVEFAGGGVAPFDGEPSEVLAGFAGMSFDAVSVTFRSIPDGFRLIGSTKPGAYWSVSYKRASQRPSGFHELSIGSQPYSVAADYTFNNLPDSAKKRIDRNGVTYWIAVGQDTSSMPSIITWTRDEQVILTIMSTEKFSDSQLVHLAESAAPVSERRAARLRGRSKKP